MKNTVKLDKIKMTIDGAEIELTPEQAKDLQKILNELWPPAPVERIVERHVPYIPYQPPVIIERWPEIPWWQPPTYITCESTGNTTLCLATNESVHR